MIGRTLGNYRIVEQIGLGGMATVFKAYDPDTDRYVAVKILPQHFSHDPQFRERFKREAKAIAKLEHLHILPIFAYGEDDGIAYMAMRYLPAGTLTDRIDAGPLSLTEAEQILHQLANALDHAHSHNILHRDLKPSNVLLDDEGNAFLMDFGIAKIVEATVDLTGDRLLGTPAYMSPEQCQGTEIGPATDIYSLGIILYEMVTGKRPFDAETPVAVILQQLNDPLPPPRELRPDLPELAENVIFKALAKKPASRYKSASKMAAAFSHAIAAAPTAISPTQPPSAPSPVPAPTPSPTTPATKRSLPTWAWGLVGVVVAAFLITMGILLASGPGSGGDDEAAETAAQPDQPAQPNQTAQPPRAAAVPPGAPPCEPGKTLLFFDDFEDGDFAGWDLFDAEGRPATAGWYVASYDDNTVLVGNDHAWAHAPATFGRDYVLHLRYHPFPDPAAPGAFHLNVRMGPNGRYFIHSSGIRREPGLIELASWEPRHDQNWHTMTVRVQENHIALFRDNEQIASFDDPEAHREGIIALENISGVVWYDDVQVCVFAPDDAGADTAVRPNFTAGDQIMGHEGLQKSALGDLDNDGDLDAFLPYHGANEVWLNDGNGRFTNTGQNLGQENSNEVALGDLDGDGDLDAFVGNFQSDQAVWLNDGNGYFTTSEQGLSGSDGWSVALGDVDGDGDLDVLDGSGGPNTLWLNDGAAGFSHSGQFLGQGDTVQVALADLDGDDDLDAFLANWGTGEPNEVWLNDGDGRFHQSQQLGQSGSIGAALDDLDGDGDADALVANGSETGEPNRVWLNEGNGRFQDSGQLLANEDSWAVALGDLDGDGDLDAFVANGAGQGGQPNSVWINDGGGRFRDSRLRLGQGSSRGVVLADLDQDGDLDAFVSSEDGARIWWHEAPKDAN